MEIFWTDFYKPAASNFNKILTKLF